MAIDVGKLYIVATPIGNLADITYRAVEILKKVDIIAAEDTRTTGVLLKKYNITTPLESYHKFCEKEKSDFFIEKIKEGKNIALVSDAGTPLISDPGNILVSRAEKNSIQVVPIGGVCAVTSLACAVARKDEDFKFTGFLPKVEAQIELLIKENLSQNLIFYQSPKRIMKTFEIIKKIRPDATISIGRELTKKFEEIKTSSVLELIKYYTSYPPRGEIICMLHKTDEKPEELNIKNKILDLKNAGFSQKQTAQILQITDNIPKNISKLLFLEN